MGFWQSDTSSGWYDDGSWEGAGAQAWQPERHGPKPWEVAAWGPGWHGHDHWEDVEDLWPDEDPQSEDFEELKYDSEDAHSVSAPEDVYGSPWTAQDHLTRDPIPYTVASTPCLVVG
jgi:hypothetical protein